MVIQWVMKDGGMKKARLANGQIILAQQYQHAAHGGDLFCADPGCDAPMGFRKEALTHGSLALKSACFFSKNVKDHRHDCSAHAPSALQARARKSLEQAIREEKNIVINLNVPLTAQFNSVARVSLRQPSTDKVDKYVPVGARNIEDMLDYIDTISDRKSVV